MRKIFTLICLMAASLSGLNAQVLDQDVSGSVSAGWLVNNGSYTSLGQSFTAGITGPLHSIDIYLDASNGVYPLIAGTFSITVVAGDGYGGTVLGSANFTITGSESTGFYNIPFSPGAVNLTAGNVYTYIVDETSGTGQIMLSSAGAIYPNGILYSQVGANPPSTFASYDFLFKTYMDVAPPCAITDQTVTISTSTFCDNGSAWVDLASTQNGVLYSLRDNSNNAVVGNPAEGEGAALSLNTGNLTSTTSFNVLAETGNGAMNSLSFAGNGSGDMVNVGTSMNAFFTGSDAITVEAWVYSTNGSNNLQTVVGNYENSLMQFLLRLDNMKPTFWVSNGSFSNAQATTTLTTNTWYHIAGTWDGANIKIYVNGVLEATTPKTGVFPTVSNDLKIGGGLSNNSEFFHGNISSVRIWDHARSAVQINNNTNSCLSGQTPGLVALYNMEDGTGSSILTDETGNGFEGTLTNMDVNASWSNNKPSFSCVACQLQMTQIVTATVNNSTSSTISPSSCVNYTSPSGNYTYTTSGIYNDTIANAVGCDSVITINLTINQPTTGTDVQTTCAPITWIDGNTYSASTNTPTHTLVNAVGCDSVVTLNLTVNSLPSVATTTSGITITATETGASYQWIDCNNSNAVISGATSQSFTASSNGSYAVIVNNGNCSDTSACVNITTVGVSENGETVFAAIFPNPANDQVFVKLNNLSNNYKLTIVDAVGREMESQNIVNTVTTINTSGYSSGVYFVKIFNGSEQQVLRLIIE